MARKNSASKRFDVRAIADRYFQEQCERLGPLDYTTQLVFVPVPTTPKRNRRKRTKGE